jgi:hypothetical protein
LGLEERIFAEKVRASLKTILKHLAILKDRTERQWEEVEIALLHLFIDGKVPRAGELNLDYLGDFYRRLETLRDFIHLHDYLFREELERYNLYRNFPADVYSRFLEKLSEFNRTFWR